MQGHSREDLVEIGLDLSKTFLGYHGFRVAPFGIQYVNHDNGRPVSAHLVYQSSGQATRPGPAGSPMLEVLLRYCNDGHSGRRLLGPTPAKRLVEEKEVGPLHDIEYRQ